MMFWETSPKKPNKSTLILCKPMQLRVLVIDDDEMFNLMTKVILRDLGVSSAPQCFISGQEALADIDQHQGSDVAYLLFLDINMPTMSGWDVLDYLQASSYHQHIHVVIVTSSIDHADRERAFRYPRVIDFMTKPLKRESLASLKAHKKIAAFFSN